MLVVPLVSPFAYVILPLINALINLVATLFVWLAIPALTLIHLAKAHSRQEELLTRIDTQENALITQLSDTEKFFLGANLDAKIIQYEQSSMNSTQFKELYCNPNSSKTLETKLQSISEFITAEDQYNAGRGISETILSTLQKAQAHLPWPPKVNSSKTDEDEEIVEAQTSTTLGS